MSKLYATATSEKASKGQGGNEYIAIKLLMEDGETFAKLYYHINEQGEYELLNEDNDEIIYTRQKGKSQKGEKCRKCEEYHNEGMYHICPDNQ